MIVTEQTHVRILDESAAPRVWSDTWLPDDAPFPELTELREEYMRINAQWQEAGARVWALLDRQEAAKAEREVALRDAVLAGTDPPAEDDNSDLERELEQAREQARAAWRALVEHVNRAVATVCEYREEWLDNCRRAEAGIRVEAEDLQKQLLAVLRKRGQFFRLEHWIDRTSGMAAEMPALHLAYSDIPSPPSSDPAEYARELQALMVTSYAGSQTLSDE